MVIKDFKIKNKRLLCSILAASILSFPCTKSVKADTIIVTPVTTESDASNGFYIGFPRTYTKMHMLDNTEIDNILLNRNIQRNIDNGGSYYSFNINNMTYTYRPCASLLSCGNVNIGCKIYATSDCDFSNITNIVTVIGGTGDRISGVNLDGKSLGKNSIVVVCYTKNRDISTLDRSELIGSCTRIMNMIFAPENSAYNSIVGFSEGAQAAFVVAANNPGLYQTLVCSNGAPYWTNGGVNLISRYSNAQYRSFRNMEIIFLESKNNNNWNPYIIQTLMDLRNHNVPVHNISLYTNDYDLLNGYTGIYFGEESYPSAGSVLGSDDNIYFLSDREAYLYGGWEKHGDGIRMITDSNILSYLTSPSHLARYSLLSDNRQLSIRNK